MHHWLTVEVFDGDRPVAGLTAAGWARAWQDRIVEAAVTGGAVFWDEHEHSWGVVLEFTFAEEHLRDAFRDSPLLRAALEERGWVTRSSCPTDRRGQVASLTDAGRGELERTAPGHVDEVRRRVFDVLSDDEVAQLRALAEKLSAAAEL